MTTLYEPIQRHPYVVFSRDSIRIGLFFCELDDRGLGEVESVDEEILHAVGVVYATLEFVSRAPIRDPDDHRPLPAVRRWRSDGLRRRRGTMLRWGRGMAALGRRDAAGIGDFGDGTAYGASD